MQEIGTGCSFIGNVGFFSISMFNRKLKDWKGKLSGDGKSPPVHPTADNGNDCFSNQGWDLPWEEKLQEQGQKVKA